MPPPPPIATLLGEAPRRARVPPAAPQDATLGIVPLARTAPIHRRRAGGQPCVVWFRGHDLRIRDQDALEEAAARANGDVVAVYVLSASYGDAQRRYLHDSLVVLQAELGKIGVRLAVRKGGVVEELRKFCADVGAADVVWTRRWKAWYIDEDVEVAQGLALDGVEGIGVGGEMLVAPPDVRGNFLDFYSFFEYWLREIRDKLPSMPVERFDIGDMKGGMRQVGEEDIDSLALKEGLEKQGGPRAGCVFGEESLVRFVTGVKFEKFADSAARRDGVLLEDKGTSSRLSPHVRYGELSPRLIFHAIVNAGAERGADGLSAARAFLKNICLREFGYYTLYRNPLATDRPIVPEYHAFPWALDEGGKIEYAWQTGTTGYPIVDAAMRQLKQEGWIHNRLRYLVAAFFCKYLLLPWHKGARFLVQHLVDGDEACNTLGWQWIQGCHSDALPSTYIVNPAGTESNGVRSMHDAAAYVRKYVPELAHLPDDHIFEPWTVSSTGLTQDADTVVVNSMSSVTVYPARVVLGKDARPRARHAIDVMRRIFQSQNVQRCIIEDMHSGPGERLEIENGSQLAHDDAMELEMRVQAAAAAADFEIRGHDPTHADAVDALSLLSNPYSSSPSPSSSGAKRPRTGVLSSEPVKKRHCVDNLSLISGVTDETDETPSTLRRPPSPDTTTLEMLSREPTSRRKRQRSKLTPIVPEKSQARGPISITSLLSAAPSDSLSPPSVSGQTLARSRHQATGLSRLEPDSKAVGSLPFTPLFHHGQPPPSRHHRQPAIAPLSQPGTPQMGGPGMAAQYPGYSASSPLVNFQSPNVGMNVVPHSHPRVQSRTPTRQPQLPQQPQHPQHMAMHYQGAPSPGLSSHPFPVAYGGGAPMNQPFGVQGVSHFAQHALPYSQHDHQQQLQALPMAQYMEQQRAGGMQYGHGTPHFAMQPGGYPMQVVPGPQAYMMGMPSMAGFPQYPHMPMPPVPQAKDITARAGPGAAQGHTSLGQAAAEKSLWIAGSGAGGSQEPAPGRCAVIRPNNCADREIIARRMAAMDYEDPEVSGKHREQWQVIALHLLKEYEFTNKLDRHTSKDFTRLCALKDELREGSKVWITVNHIKEVFRILNVPVSGEYDRRGHGGVRGPYVYGTRPKRAGNGDGAKSV